MKTTLPLLLITCILALSCEQVEYVDVIKYIDSSAVKPKFIDRVFAGLGSTKIPGQQIPVETKAKDGKDSIIYVQGPETIIYDSIFITQQVVEHDTILLYVSVPSDTVVKFWDMMSYSISEPAVTYLNDFSQRATAKGLTIDIEGIVVYSVPMDITAQSFQVSNNYIVMVNSQLPPEQQYIPILRELSRHYLGQKYSSDPESILNPFYPANKITWVNRSQHEAEIDQLFTINQ